MLRALLIAGGSVAGLALTVYVAVTGLVVLIGHSEYRGPCADTGCRGCAQLAAAINAA